tara:strand:+ start:1723 stop:2019 length:297 start_codon:yes stop_codon:yes gene_type:complete
MVSESLFSDRKNFERSIIFIVFYSIIKTSYRSCDSLPDLIYLNHYVFMNDPILLISMFLGLGGIFVLINSFSDDDDSDNDGGMGSYIYNLEPIAVGNK